MGKEKKEEVLFEEEFGARVNHGEVVETILRRVGGTETFILRGKSSKFKSDGKYRVTITEIPQAEPEPEQ